MRQDADAPLKIVQDTLTKKLGFDDRHIVKCEIERSDELSEGVQVTLKEIK